jgi:hypothetical protein
MAMSDSLGNERRRFRRFPVEGSVKLYSGSAMWSSTLIDMSLRGVLVERPDGWTGGLGTRYRLDLRLEGGVMIGMGVELSRIANGHLGFACQKIDLDSFARLKRLIELNLGNTEILNRELAVLGA